MDLKFESRILVFYFYSLTLKPDNIVICFRWLETVECRPGFNTAVLKALQDKAANNPQEYKHCTLMLDAMSLKRQIDYDQKLGRMVGFVDIGDGEDPSDEAKEALVFMLVGLRGHWKMPIAFFLTRTLNAAVQSRLIKHALQLANDSGLVITALTMDGHATNVSMCSLLGCTLKPNNVQSFFVDPVSQRRIFIFFDACHMLKLVRNMLEAYSALESKDGSVLWRHIKDLQNLQVVKI